MLAKDSSSVAPCDQHPGRPGQETLYPSSVCIKATGYFMLPTLTCPLFGDCRYRAESAGSVKLQAQHADLAGGRGPECSSAAPLRGARCVPGYQIKGSVTHGRDRKSVRQDDRAGV